MTRRKLAGAAVAVLAASGVATGAGMATTAQAAQPGAWVETGTQALHLHATSLGAAPAHQQMQISVALGLRNRSAAEQRITEQAQRGSQFYHHYLTPAQVTARYGPTAAQAAKVSAYLRSSGFSHVSVERNRLLVNGTAPVATVERAFHTRIADFRLHGQRVYANTAAAMVPHALGSTVSAVLGLSDIPMTGAAKPAATKPAATTAGSPDLSGFVPTAVAHAYDADTIPWATNTSVAVVMAGDPTNTIKNLRTAERAWHRPAVPVTVEWGAGAKEDAWDNPLTDSVEWDLDTQYSTMVAGSVQHLYMYDVATYTDPEVARAFEQFVEQDKALTLSASLGECETLAYADGAMLATDDILAEGALQGQSSFASSGDNGSSCPVVISTGVPGSGPPGVSWPAVGEYTTGVGGTTLLADSDGNVSEETTWSGSGGGLSTWETAPPWTLRDNPAGQTWEENNYGGRGVPDVAAVADSTTPVLVYAGGTTPEGVGGTSVASPVVESLWARIQNADNGRLGLASADLYDLYNETNPGTKYVSAVGLVAYAPQVNPQPVPGLRDIELGSNGLYSATPGYDYTSGVGALLAKPLVQLLK